MEYTGKQIEFEYKGRKLRLCNQSCPDWTHPYSYPSPTDMNDNLHIAGCGIFGLSHMIEYHCGERIDIEAMADFAMACGGRGDDGTDRPVLLDALQKAGKLAPYGLEYRFEGSINDHDALWDVMISGGKALCDLRVGHIVCLVDCRIKDGEKQVLVIDSSRDSMHPSVRGDVREVITGTEITAPYTNSKGVCTGLDMHYAMFWVPLSKPYDFNLLRKIK